MSYFLCMSYLEYCSNVHNKIFLTTLEEHFVRGDFTEDKICVGYFD